MEFDYFYGQQSEQFSFYRIPKMLFTDDRFWNVSTDAKLLYGILLDRMNLSAKNGWIDEEKLLRMAKSYGKSSYGQHLRAVAEGKILYSTNKPGERPCWGGEEEKIYDN